MQQKGDAIQVGARIGHDQLFKQLLHAFFPDFLRPFDPETAAALDLSTVNFRDTEAITDFPQGERRLAGLRRVHQARLAGEIDDARAFLLVNVIATYLPLSARERDELGVQLQQEGDLTMEATELTWADQIYLEGREEGRTQGREEGRTQGREEGRTQGRVQGLRDAIERLVRARFGRVTPELEARLAAMTREDELTAFVERVATARGEADLLAS